MTDRPSSLAGFVPLPLRKGAQDDPLDAMIAAAAAGNALNLATRNIGDFTGFGVTLFNPWTEHARSMTS